MNKNGRLSEIEKEAFLRIFGKKIMEICDGDLKEIGMSLSYHVVKGYEYPALVVSCRGRKKKIHINKLIKQAYVEMVARIKTERLLEEIKKLKEINLYLNNIDIIITLFESLEEIEKGIWERLYQKFLNDIPPKYLKKWVFEDRNTSVEVFDMVKIKKIKIKITQRNLGREKTKYELIPYECVEGNSYLLSISPIKVLKIVPSTGIKADDKWVVKKIANKLHINLENL